MLLFFDLFEDYLLLLLEVEGRDVIAESYGSALEAKIKASELLDIRDAALISLFFREVESHAHGLNVLLRYLL